MNASLTKKELREICSRIDDNKDLGLYGIPNIRPVHQHLRGVPRKRNVPCSMEKAKAATASQTQ